MTKILCCINEDSNFEILAKDDEAIKMSEEIRKEWAEEGGGELPPAFPTIKSIDFDKYSWTYFYIEA